jgi:hypothetical protein
MFSSLMDYSRFIIPGLAGANKRNGQTETVARVLGTGAEEILHTGNNPPDTKNEQRDKSNDYQAQIQRGIEPYCPRNRHVQTAACIISHLGTASPRMNSQQMNAGRHGIAMTEDSRNGPRALQREQMSILSLDFITPVTILYLPAKCNSNNSRLVNSSPG